ncbi:efflux RND transporter periplasmic adaptor subunit [Chitinophaga caseinilytica]|uniref:Efflux RND transporter periplasmic adaptor subunit n=1 Tax=Chitinophaga caseinilytica TaxID=2267521 RepID=A0ABZ2YZA8_9BACT
MKKRFTVNILTVLTAVLFAACGAAPVEKKGPSAKTRDSLPLLFPQQRTRIVVMEAPGTVRYDSRNRAILPSRVAGRIEKLHVRYNYQPVRKGQLILEIYAPELVAAQRELLSVSNDPAMKELALRKLALMGMPETLAAEVLRTRQVRVTIPLYSNADGYILEESLAAAAAAPSTAAPAPSQGGDAMGNMGAAAPMAASAAPAPTQSPVMLREGQYVSAGQNLFSIYKTGRMIAEFALPAEVASAVGPGSRVLVSGNGMQGELKSAAINLLEPLYANGEKFSRARVYLNGNYPAGQLLTAYIPVLFREGSWVPVSAIVKLGKDNVVFRKEGADYRAVPVRIGARAGGLVQLFDEVQAIAANAAYIADSEGFIKPDAHPSSHP